MQAVCYLTNGLNNDHVYTNDITNISQLAPVETVIGDHSLITILLRDDKKMKPIISYKRDWSKYSKEMLCNELMKHNIT